MNTITKFISAVACALVCFGLNGVSATTIYDVYDSYFSSGYTPGTSTINQFDTPEFMSDYQVFSIPNAFTAGTFNNRPIIAGKPLVCTIIGARNPNSNIPTSAVNPCVSDAYIYLNGNSITSPIGFPLIFSRGYGGIKLYPYAQSIEKPYLLNGTTYALSFPLLANVGGYTWVDWSANGQFPFSSWNFYNVNITDPGYQHIAAIWYSTWDGLSDGAQLPNNGFFDIVFDIAIPIPIVPEPHIYVLIGSMLALAYVLGRKKAKVQC